MKQTIYTIIALILINIGTIKAQNSNDLETFRATIYPSSAIFPGGESAMMKFIANNLKYPNTDINIEGKVITQFLVKESGIIDSVKILRGLHPDYDNEVIRVVKLMPKWTPAKLNGKGVEEWYTLPISFRLNDKQIVQTDTISKDTVLHIAEVMPKYPEGEIAMMKFISESVKYPITNGSDGGIQGRVVLRFVVTKTGDIKHIWILRGISESCNREAIRVVESMPKWIPGKQDGKEVNVYFNLPILFKMR